MFSRVGKARRGLVEVLLVGTALATMGSAGTALAQGAPVAASQATTSFNVPAQSLQNALTTYGRQAGLQVSVDAAVLRGLGSAGVSGSMSAEAAIGRVLAGTGLSYRFSGTTVVVSREGADVGQVPADGSTVLDTITVRGSGQTATGPVDGYRAERTATGTKTDTALRDIPQSIQVVSRDAIEDRQAQDLSDTLENVSGVQRNSTAGNRSETFIIRGFSTPGYAIDGVMTNPTGDRPEVFMDMAGIERVEVLKGPASALYGRGEPGGLINIVTRQPTDTFEADASTQIGSFGLRRAEATVSGPLNEDGTLTGRLSGAAQTEEGFRGWLADSERQFIGGVLRWEPTDDTRVTLAVDHTHQNLPWDRGLPVTADNEVSLPYDTFLGEEWSKIDAKKTRVSLNAEHDVNEQLTVRGSISYDSAYVHDLGIDLQELRADGRTMRRRYSDRIEDSDNIHTQFEAQLEFDTGTIAHTMLGGVQYSFAKMDFLSSRANIADIDIYNPVYGAAMPIPALNNHYRNDIHVASLFLQDQMEFSEQWKALVGLRYDRVWQTMEQYRQGEQTSPDMNDGALTGRLGVVYQPIEPLSLYASFSQSFAPQGGQTIDGKALDPEEGWQIEAGAKYELIPDRLSFTASVFQTTKNNVATEDPADSDASRLTGEQRVRGVEFDINGEILPGWRVMASAAYLEAIITKDDILPIGNRLTGVPEWSGSLWTTYEFQDGHLEGLTLGTGVQLVGEREGNLENQFNVDGYYRLDAMASYKFNEHLQLSVVGRNLTNERYIETPVSKTENAPGAPRSVMATLKATF